MVNANLPEVTSDTVDLLFKFNGTGRNHDISSCFCDVHVRQIDNVIEFRPCLIHTEISFAMIKSALAYYNVKVFLCKFTNDQKPEDCCRTFLFTDEVLRVLAASCPNLHKLSLKFLDLTALSSAVFMQIRSSMTSLVELDVEDCYKVTAFNARSFKTTLEFGSLTEVRIRNSYLVDDKLVQRFASSIERMTHLELNDCPQVTCFAVICIVNVLEKISKECRVQFSNHRTKCFDEQTVLKLLDAYPLLDWSAVEPNELRPSTLNVFKKCAPYRVAKILNGQFFVERLRF